jgi:hypothetical protein
MRGLMPETAPCRNAICRFLRRSSDEKPSERARHIVSAARTPANKRRFTGLPSSGLARQNLQNRSAMRQSGSFA